MITRKPVVLIFCEQLITYLVLLFNTTALKSTTSKKEIKFDKSKAINYR